MDARSAAYNRWNMMSWDDKLAFADSLGIWGDVKDIARARLDEEAEDRYREDGVIYGISSSDINHVAMGELSIIFVEARLKAQNIIAAEVDNYARLR